jgi:hypothetical protein
LLRVLQVEPSSERIVVEDYKALLPRVLQKIVDAQGCVVPDEFLTSDRHKRRSDGKVSNTPRILGAISAKEIWLRALCIQIHRRRTTL